MTRQSPTSKHLTALDIVSGLDLSERRIIVTGANSGIGFETARALARAGASVLLACRDRERGMAAQQAISAERPEGAARFEPLDLASLESVRRFCASPEAQAADSVICNAGVYAPRWQATADGFELTLGVCHLGHFLLVRELLPGMLSHPDPRVVMVSSESHRMPATLQLDNLPFDAANYRGMKSYGQAKLCNVLMASELHRRFRAQGLTACALHPGTLVTTGFGAASPVLRTVMRLVSPFTKSAGQGAATSVHCAVHPDTDVLAGGYLVDCRAAAPSAEARNEDVARRLWEASEQWLAAVANPR